MKKIKKTPNTISMREVIASLRKPLPPKTGGAHKPKTAYNRKRDRREIRNAHKSGGLED